MNLFKKNILSILGLVVTILGIILAFYFGKEKKREPVYLISSRPSMIFDKSNSTSKIKILVNDSLLITNNIFIATVEVWNNGNLSITKEDLRRDFYIYCSDSTSKILDYRILNERISGISNFKLLTTNQGLKIDWDYFDPGFGFIFQIIYTGTKNTSIKISGYVLGAEVKNLPDPIVSGLFKLFFWTFIILIPILSFVSWASYKLEEKEIQKDVKSTFFSRYKHQINLMNIIICVLMLLLIIVTERKSLIKSPFETNKQSFLIELLKGF